MDIDKYKKNCDFVNYDVDTKEIELLCDRGHQFKISRFNIYEKDSNQRWQELPSENEFCIKVKLE